MKFHIQWSLRNFRGKSVATNCADSGERLQQPLAEGESSDEGEEDAPDTRDFKNFRTDLENPRFGLKGKQQKKTYVAFGGADFYKVYYGSFLYQTEILNDI